MSTSDIRARLQAGEAIDPPTLIALLDELERLRGDTEWEYGNALINTDGYPTGLVMPAREGEVEDWGLRRVRRRKAGPWELVGGETDD